MSVKGIAINSFAALMVGSAAFNEIKDAVSVISSQNLTGVEKRAIVIRDLENLVGTIGAWALNLGIELAVAWLKGNIK